MKLSQALPFLAPFVLFMLFLMLVDAQFPDQHYLLYPVKALLAGAAILWFWKALPPLKPTAPFISMVIGIVAVVIWVGLYPWAIQLDAFLIDAYNRVVLAVGLDSWKMAQMVKEVGRNPFTLYPATEAWALFALRVAGIAVVVPILEELFWRGFLMRWLIKDDFTKVPLGTYEHTSFWITTAMFASVHGPLWPLAVIVGVIYGGWFVRTKSLGNVMVAHGVTNLLLALYCLYSDQWHFLSSVTPPKP